MGSGADPSRSRSKQLRAGPETPVEARWFIAQAIESFEIDVDRDAAVLLTSEVAANAARHGKEPIDLTVSVEEQDLRVSIFDRGAGFDPAEHLGAEDGRDGGWGLRIVEELSSEWGVDRRDDGTEVWFRL